MIPIRIGDIVIEVVRYKIWPARIYGSKTFGIKRVVIRLGSSRYICSLLTKKFASRGPLEGGMPVGYRGVLIWFLVLNNVSKVEKSQYTDQLLFLIIFFLWLYFSSTW